MMVESGSGSVDGSQFSKSTARTKESSSSLAVAKASSKESASENRIEATKAGFGGKTTSSLEISKQATVKNVTTSNAAGGDHDIIAVSLNHVDVRPVSSNNTKPTNCISDIEELSNRPNVESEVHQGTTNLVNSSEQGGGRFQTRSSDKSLTDTGTGSNDSSAKESISADKIGDFLQTGNSGEGEDIICLEDNRQAGESLNSLKTTKAGSENLGLKRGVSEENFSSKCTLNADESTNTYKKGLRDDTMSAKSEEVTGTSPAKISEQYSVGKSARTNSALISEPTVCNNMSDKMKSSQKNIPGRTQAENDETVVLELTVPRSAIYTG
jgi:hypothetical protein